MIIKFLKYICKNTVSPDKSLCMLDVLSKFGKAGRTSAVSLCQEHLISWDSSDDDSFAHDDSCRIKPTDKGILENERYKYIRQLKSSEIWKERIFGFLSGVLATAVADLIIKHL